MLNNSFSICRLPIGPIKSNTFEPKQTAANHSNPDPSPLPRIPPTDRRWNLWYYTAISLARSRAYWSHYPNDIVQVTDLRWSRVIFWWKSTGPTDLTKKQPRPTVRPSSKPPKRWSIWVGWLLLHLRMRQACKACSRTHIRHARTRSRVIDACVRSLCQLFPPGSVKTRQ